MGVTAVDGGEPEIELSDDPYAVTRIDVSGSPVLVTLARIGNHCIVDSTVEEESCSSASIVVAVTPKGGVAAIRKVGGGSFHPGTLVSATKLACSVGTQLNMALSKKIQQEEILGDD